MPPACIVNQLLFHFLLPTSLFSPLSCFPPSPPLLLPSPPPSPSPSPELPLYILLGFLCGAVSVALTRSSRIASSFFDSLAAPSPSSPSPSSPSPPHIPRVLLPALGATCVGAVSLLYPEVLYWGFQNVNDLLSTGPKDFPGVS